MYQLIESYYEGRQVIAVGPNKPLLELMGKALYSHQDPNRRLYTYDVEVVRLVETALDCTASELEVTPDPVLYTWMYITYAIPSVSLITKMWYSNQIDSLTEHVFVNKHYTVKKIVEVDGNIIVAYCAEGYL